MFRDGRIGKLLRKNYHGDEAPDEFEIVEVIGIDVRSGIDLKTVVVLVSVLKEAVHRIEDFVGEQEEPLSGDPAVVEPFLSAEDDVEPPAELVGRKAHDLVVGILKEGLTVQSDLDM